MIKLLEKILASENLNIAFKKVISNKGTHGIDGMTSEQFLSYLERNGENLINSVFSGEYIPQPVRRIKIPKSNGKMRTLGIPTMIDRLIQRAIVQILMPIYEAKFSRASFAFRPERGIDDALNACIYYFNRDYVWTVDMDLEKFFDSVCRKKLIQILRRDIDDSRVLNLIKLFINSGSIENGSPVKTSAGIHQGGPLSPLLANIMLNELDEELTRRQENFVRYADDIVIFCHSVPAAYQALKHISPFIEKNLRLKINPEKTMIAHADKLKFLGCKFIFTPQGYKFFHLN